MVGDCCWWLAGRGTRVNALVVRSANHSGLRGALCDAHTRSFVFLELVRGGRFLWLPILVGGGVFLAHGPLGLRCSLPNHVGCEWGVACARGEAVGYLLAKRRRLHLSGYDDLRVVDDLLAGLKNRVGWVCS